MLFCKLWDYLTKLNLLLQSNSLQHIHVLGFLHDSCHARIDFITWSLKSYFCNCSWKPDDKFNRCNTVFISVTLNVILGYVNYAYNNYCKQGKGYDRVWPITSRRRTFTGLLNHTTISWYLIDPYHWPLIWITIDVIALYPIVCVYLLMKCLVAPSSIQNDDTSLGQRFPRY